jgi:hypothetical protein
MGWKGANLDMLLVNDGGVLPFMLPGGQWFDPALEETSFKGVCRDIEDPADRDVWSAGRETTLSWGVDWVKFARSLPIEFSCADTCLDDGDGFEWAVFGSFSVSFLMLIMTSRA